VPIDAAIRFRQAIRIVERVLAVFGNNPHGEPNFRLTQHLELFGPATKRSSFLARGYDILAVSPTNSRRYADPGTQTAFDMWEARRRVCRAHNYGIQAGVDALRERIRQLAGLG
jgi:hypothetical protein